MIGDRKLVSMDVDGTLYDPSAFRRALVFRLLAETLRRPASTLRDLYRLWRFHRAARAVRRHASERAYRCLASRSDGARETMIRHYGRCLEEIGPRDGVGALIDRLRKRGTRVVAVTDFVCAYKLDALGLSDRFDGLLEGEVLWALKPDPRLFRLLLETYGVQENDVLHIGDKSHRDAAGARGAGIQCLIVGRDFDSFGDLNAE